jgi:hypothetical protein
MLESVPLGNLRSKCSHSDIAQHPSDWARSRHLLHRARRSAGLIAKATPQLRSIAQNSHLCTSVLWIYANARQELQASVRPHPCLPNG